MYQFAHVESYSLSAPKTAIHKNKKSGKPSGKVGRSVSYIVDEALRAEGSTAHIESPLPPVYRFGKPLEEVEAKCSEWTRSLVDARGHALRKDALCLLAGVISAPKDITEEGWKAFSTDSIEWLKKRYGETLHAVVEHVDESHPHLHFYAIAAPGERFESVHEGRLAAHEAKAQGLKKGDQNRAYKAAMRGFQDDFYEKVGIEHGFTRIGPARRRLTREEWKLEQVEAAAAARAIAVATEKVRVSEARSVDILAKATGGAAGIEGAAQKEAQDLRDKAKKDALGTAKKALIEADKIKLEAHKKGISEGLDKVEKSPWFKRLSAVIGRAVGQRDKLQKAVTELSAERDKAERESVSWSTRARRYLKVGEALKVRVREIQPALLKATAELNETRKLKDHNALLLEDLSRARGRIKHLEAVYVTEAEEKPQTAPERLRSPKKDSDIALG
jgi:hypothetical protein